VAFASCSLILDATPRSGDGASEEGAEHRAEGDASHAGDAADTTGRDDGGRDTGDPATEGCAGNGDCPDDGDVCNGTERCDTSRHVCVHDNPAAAGTPCDDGLFCTKTDACDGAGACAGTGGRCASTECRSSTCNETTDACDTVDALDMMPCGAGAGACCDGECRTGAQCCGNADCPFSCTGSVVPCVDFTSFLFCRDQAGCYLDPSGSCGDGGPRTCNYSFQTDCVDCGCSWLADPSPGTCYGSGPTPCNMLGVILCDRCGVCAWTPSGNLCNGTATPCASFTGSAACARQRNCSWSSQTCDPSTKTCVR